MYNVLKRSSLCFKVCERNGCRVDRDFGEEEEGGRDVWEGIEEMNYGECYWVC